MSLAASLTASLMETIQTPFVQILLQTLFVLVPACVVCSARRARAAGLRVRSVDLYPSGAKFVFAVEPDPDGFELELPGAFEAGSVRLLNPGSAEDLKVIEDSRASWVPPALTELRAQTEAQRKAVALLNARKASLEQTQALLRDVRPRASDASGLLAYIQEAQAMKLNTGNELAEVELSLENEEEKLDLLEGELSSRTPVNAGNFLRITGRTCAGQPLLIEAFTTAARWYPRYTMDLNSATGAIQTHMYARASQHTGLDYEGPVTFHTKIPDEDVQAPELKALRVGLRSRTQPPRAGMRGAAMMSMAARAFVAEDAREMDEGPVVLAEATAPVMEATLSDHIVQGSGALTGDGRESEFVLGELRLTGKPLLIAIPEQRNNAWIVVDMDDAATPLIPGTASLRVDGQPAGSTTLPEYGLGQARIPFGYALQITARKEPIVEKSGKSWFSGVFTGGYTLEVANGMKEEKVVTVRDRLPIPTDDKVTLEVKRIDPEPRERDEQNRLTWDLPVKPGETAKIIVDYTLSYPSGEELQYR